jgi:hypothetical protein
LWGADQAPSNVPILCGRFSRAWQAYTIGAIFYSSAFLNVDGDKCENRGPVNENGRRAGQRAGCTTYHPARYENTDAESTTSSGVVDAARRAEAPNPRSSYRFLPFVLGASPIGNTSSRRRVAGGRRSAAPIIQLIAMTDACLTSRMPLSCVAPAQGRVLRSSVRRFANRPNRHVYPGCTPRSSTAASGKEDATVCQPPST